MQQNLSNTPVLYFHHSYKINLTGVCDYVHKSKSNGQFLHPPLVESLNKNWQFISFLKYFQFNFYELSLHISSDLSVIYFADSFSSVYEAFEFVMIMLDHFFLITIFYLHKISLISLVSNKTCNQMSYTFLLFTPLIYATKTQASSSALHPR